MSSSVDSAKTVVVLGGGVGGVVAATTLRKLLPSPHRVIVVDRERDHVFSPSLLWLMTGGRTARQISRRLDRLTRRGVEVVRGEVEAIDATNRVVIVAEVTGDGTQSREIRCDHLILALGAALAPESISGLSESGHSFYTLAGAESLRRALEGFTGGRIVVLTAAPAYKCPAAPYEAAMLIDDHLRRRGLEDRAQVSIYAAEPGPMGVAGPEVSAGVRAMVEAKGIDYHPEHQVVEVDPVERRLRFANGATASFDLLAFVPPHVAPQVVLEARLTAEGGWVPVDRHTLQTEFAGVYAIGDVTGIPLQMGKPLPKAGVFAEREARVVAQNIAREVTGEGEATSFDGNGECFIETGQGRAGFGRGNFYAEPTPEVKLHRVSRRWHLGKVLFEKSWLRRWF